MSENIDKKLKNILYIVVGCIILSILCYFLCGRIEKLYNKVFTDHTTVDSIKQELDGVRTEQQLLQERINESVNLLRESDRRLKERFDEDERTIRESKLIVGELLQRTEKSKK